MNKIVLFFLMVVLMVSLPLATALDNSVQNFKLVKGKTRHAITGNAVFNRAMSVPKPPSKDTQSCGPGFSPVHDVNSKCVATGFGDLHCCPTQPRTPTGRAITGLVTKQYGGALKTGNKKPFPFSATGRATQSITGLVTNSIGAQGSGTQIIPVVCYHNGKPLSKCANQHLLLNSECAGYTITQTIKGKILTRPFNPCDTGLLCINSKCTKYSWR